MGALISASMQDRLLARARAADEAAKQRGDKTVEQMIRDGDLNAYHPYRQVLSGDGIGMGDVWDARDNASILSHIGLERVADHVRSIASQLHSGRSVFLSGPTGTGKTSLAVVAFRMYEKADSMMRSTCFVRWPTFLARLCAGDWDDGTALSLQVSKVQGLVVIDDLASASLSGKENRRRLEYAETIILNRYDAGTPTLFTSNLNIESVGKQLGQRIASRLSENAVEYYIGGDDLRLSHKK